MNRAELTRQLESAPVFDVAVVGGGATGLGVALDAALRGFSVALFESHDFAGGTSSRSTKLLHGGVRYLAQGNVTLVREALAERTAIMTIAPHLAQPLPFVMPSYHWWQTPFYGLGLKLYDVLAGKAGLGSTEILGPEAVLAALPGVQSRGLVGGVRYWDGQFDDARLAIALARTAERAGAQVLNYARVSSVKPVPGEGQRAHELQVTDRLTQKDFRVRARCVINATGVWVDELRRQADGESLAPMVRPSQGVHLVVDREFMPGGHALLVPRTADGRVLFAVPWLGKLILGTTDTPRNDLPREPQPFDAELDFILSEASRAFSRPVCRADVRSVWVGLRPLVAPPKQHGGTQSLSREHTVVVDSNGLVTVTGGKWTTYRAMAEDVLRQCAAAGLLESRQEGKTAHHLLIGAEADRQPKPLCDEPGPHLYGSEATELSGLPGADRILGMGLTEAMVRFAVRREYAHTVEDVLARRSRILFLDASVAEKLASEVARIVEDETGMSAGLEEFLRLVPGYQLHPSHRAA